MWAAPPQCGYWGSMGSFCSAPQDFGLLGFFCARFPPREARLIYLQLESNNAVSVLVLVSERSHQSADQSADQRSHQRVQ